MAIATVRIPPWSVQHSLASNLATAMLLVDYALHGTAIPTPWAAAAGARLSDQGRERLELLRPVLAHGAVLRAWLLARLEPAHPAHRSWADLSRWLAALRPADVADLISSGIGSGVRWDHPEISRAELDAILSDPARRTEALRAVLESWRCPRLEEAMALALDPPRFHAHLLALVAELWELFRPGWEEAEADLAAAAAGLAELSQTLAPSSAADLVARLTGLTPLPIWAERLQAAPSLRFIPTLHLGRFLSIMAEGDDCLVLFEPAPLRERRLPTSPGLPPDGPATTGLSLWELADLGTALVGLGDPNRLAILSLLAARGELYGQQIVEQVAIHQSTVSRNLALLERGRLVRVRRDGNMKRYSLNRERIHEVCRLLIGALGEGGQP